MTEGKASVYSLEIANPTGTVEIKNLHAPRLPDLRGKTICELSNGLWEAQRMFTLLRNLLQERFPGIKFIPFTEFPRVYEFKPDTLSKLLKEKGAEGAIVGNAA